MTVQGWSQIVVYAVVLLALAYPLGVWMAHVYSRARGDVVEPDGLQAFFRLPRESSDRLQARLPTLVAMYDIVAIAIGAACFAFTFLLLWALSRV